LVPAVIEIEKKCQYQNQAYRVEKLGLYILLIIAMIVVGFIVGFVEGFLWAI